MYRRNGRLFGLAAALLALVLGVIAVLPAAEFAVDASKQPRSLTTGVLTVANDAYGEFYVSAGTVQVRAADDATTATTRAFIKFFATDPSSAVLDGSTAALTGILIQEGDTITITCPTNGWIAIDGLTGTSQIVALQLSEGG